MSRKEARDYAKNQLLREEIAGDVFASMFENLSEFKQAIKDVNAKGLEKFGVAIRKTFRGKNKPSNNRKVLEH